MPTFDFRCAACDTVFEAVIPFGTKKFPACPSCGGKKVEKQLSVPGIVFKGTGFYKTDSRSAPAKSSSSKPAASPTTTSEEPKSAPEKEKEKPSNPPAAKEKSA